MSGRNPIAVTSQYAQLLQAALHCVTSAKLNRGANTLDTVEMFTFLEVPAVELRRRNPDTNERYQSVFLIIQHHYQVVSSEDDPRRYRVIMTGYSYAIRDHQQREILAFHWHPDRRSHEQDPHLHIGSGIVDSSAGDLGKMFSRFHIPTGQMALARVVRMLITEFNVVPNRQDWKAVIGRLLDTGETG